MIPDTQRAREGGFTLAELLVGCAIVGLLVSAAVIGLQAGMQTTQLTSGQADAQQNARVAIERVVREIRLAGLDATGAGLLPITTAAANTIVLESDLDADGAINPPPAGACNPGLPSERVRYRVVGTELRRSANPAVAACEAPIVSGVQGLTFRYFGANGAELLPGPPDITQIRSVSVAVTLQPEYQSGPVHAMMNATMADQTHLRNR